MKKGIIIGGIIGVVVLIAIISVIIIGLGKDEDNKEIGMYMGEGFTEEPRVKPILPVAEVTTVINGKEEVKLENKCNSQVWKCTIDGCEEIC